jgi:hypothetical protein
MTFPMFSVKSVACTFFMLERILGFEYVLFKANSI